MWGRGMCRFLGAQFIDTKGHANKEAGRSTTAHQTHHHHIRVLRPGHPQGRAAELAPPPPEGAVLQGRTWVEIPPVRV